MSKIRLGHPSSTGMPLYGSQREHRAFVTLEISIDGGADHHLDKATDDTGFKGAHASTMKRVELIYDRTRPSVSVREERDPATGLYPTGELKGRRLVDAPELGPRNGAGEVLEVALSFEQFAEMLTSTGHAIDCTILAYAPRGTPGEVYQEDVTPPPSIYDRAGRRMEKAQAAALAEIDAALADVEGWNTSEKVKNAARRRFSMVRQHIIENYGFVVKQAAEEMAAVSEGAATIIADKVAGLEAAGRLPAGSYRAFREGGAQALLGTGEMLAEATEKKVE